MRKNKERGYLLDTTGYPCPKCNSSDAVKFYSENVACFSCNTYWSHKGFPEDFVPAELYDQIKGTKLCPDGLPVSDEFDTDDTDGKPSLVEEIKKERQKNSRKDPLPLIEDGTYIDLRSEKQPLIDRGLDKWVCEKYDITVSRGPELILPYTNKSNEVVAQKVRNEKHPKGHWRGKTQERTLFGRQAFAPGGDILYIAFGELDAPSIHQVMKAPAISPSSGDGSLVRELKEDFDYVNSFKKIVFVPDNDDSSRAAAKAGASLFMRKSYLADLRDFKDPNDYIKARRGGDLSQALRKAKKYTPEEIASFSEGYEVLFESPPVEICSYPFNGINSKIEGVRRGELTTIKAFPGAGKTSLCRELMYHIWAETESDKIGGIFLETTEQKLLLGLVGTHLSRHITSKNREDVVSREELEAAFDQLSSPQRFFYTKKWGGCPSDRLIELIEGLAVGLDCSTIFLDHISMAIIGDDHENERLALDSLGERLKALTIALNINIHVVTHVNDDGSPRGSRILNQVSDNIISLKRDTKAEDDLVRNTTEVVVEKCRETGNTGPAGCLFYDSTTARLHDIPDYTMQEYEDKKGSKK